ncbi:hypothetical protein ACFPU0_12135 [Pseudomonas sp. GCM10022186]|uniref:hypothetical protein n=1 Tax=Pseudomonas sp. GCM10022186 TaxID=3252650 RepID=UPI003623285F
MLAKVEHGAITYFTRKTMPANRLIGVFLALTLLAACDKEAPPKPKAPPPPPPMSSSPAPAPAAPPEAPAPAAPEQPAPVPAPEAKPVPSPAPTPRPVSPPPMPVTPKEPVPTATAKAMTLDLSLPRELADTLQPDEVADELPVLPQMFVEKPAPEGPFQLNGKLLTNEREDDYWRSVEGAELQFEFKR